MRTEFINTPEGQFLWSNGREGIALLSDNGTFKAANPALCNLLGYTDIELIGMHFTEVTVSSDQEIDSKKFNQLVSGEIKSYRMTKRWRTKMGRSIAGDLLVKRWVDDILIYGSVMPIDPVVKAALGDVEAQKMIDESLGRWLRTIPKKVAKNWRSWLFMAAIITGGVGYKELIALLN